MPSLSLYSAGSNARGQLATGDLDDAYRFLPCVFSGVERGYLPMNISTIEQLSCGANHTLALLQRIDDTRELWGCGDGRRGQLGPYYVADVEKAGGEVTNATAIFRPLDLNLRNLLDTEGKPMEDFTVRRIAAGWETSYVVLSRSGRDDVLLSMGANDFGNLGIGHIPGHKTAADDTEAPHIVQLRGLVSSESASDLLSILSLYAGPHHIVVKIGLTHADGSAAIYFAGWGAARHGQLGPVHNPLGRPLPSIPTPRLIPIISPEGVTKVSLGNQHTVLLSSSSTLSALGSNRKDQLHGLDTLLEVDQVGCTWNGTYALLHSGEVVAAGSNTHSQLGRGSGGQERHGELGPVRFPFEPQPGQIVELACGSEHVVCIVECQDSMGEREVWGWGWNEHGNLGTGGTEDVDIPVRVWPRSRSDGSADEGRAIKVWAGCGTTWILVEL
ncbi:RCC1/BLIP-II [Trametes meyenii]|nr:RCC1/BLIP-II [Trametes meyenii]